MNKTAGKRFHLTEVDGRGLGRVRLRATASSFEPARPVRWDILIGLSCGWAGWGWVTARMDLLGRPVLVPAAAVLLGSVLIICARRSLREPLKNKTFQAQPCEVRMCGELVRSRLFREIHPDVNSHPSSQSEEALAVFRTR